MGSKERVIIEVSNARQCHVFNESGTWTLNQTARYLGIAPDTVKEGVKHIAERDGLTPEQIMWQAPPPTRLSQAPFQLQVGTVPALLEYLAERVNRNTGNPIYSWAVMAYGRLQQETLYGGSVEIRHPKSLYNLRIQVSPQAI